MFSARMVAAVSSTHGTSPNVAAPPVTVENAVKSTSAKTTVRMEETCSPSRTGTHTLTDTLCLCGQGSAQLSLELHQQHFVSSLQVLLPAAVRLASLAPNVTCMFATTTAEWGQLHCQPGNQPTCRCPTGFLGDQCQYSEFNYLSP